jgi:hypothetical protein
MELIKTISKYVDPDLVKALSLLLAVYIICMGLYGALVIVTFIWTLPIQLGWQPEVLGVTHFIDLSDIWTLKKAPFYILSIICTFVCVFFGRIFFQTATN